MTAVHRRKKSPAKTSSPAKPSQAVRPSNGGLLNTGNPGNAGGTGRPPSILRERLRLSYSERIAFLDRVIDGEVMQRVELPLLAVLPHVVCPNCGESGMQPKELGTALLLSFDAKVSASVKDRIAALEHQAKYGLGVLKEVSVENVRERVAATLSVIRTHCPDDIAGQVVAALRPVWT